MKPIQIKKVLNYSLFPVAWFALGFTMPNCPGQQAVQQQVDGLQTNYNELLKKFQQINQQIVTMTNDMAQVKQILPQVTNLITSQKATIEQLERSVHELEAKLAGGNGGKMNHLKPPLHKKRR